MGEQTWTSDECAAAWGVRTSTWLGYVSRGQAPEPVSVEGRRKLWDAEAVRAFPRPGVGRSRAGAGPEAEALLTRMRETAEAIAELQALQRSLVADGGAQGLEVSAMARALGISRQTATTWLQR